MPVLQKKGRLNELITNTVFKYLKQKTIKYFENNK